MLALTIPLVAKNVTPGQAGRVMGTREQRHDEAEVRRKRRWPVVSLSLAGFLLSITLALINAFYALRGSVIVVVHPKQAIIFRDGEGDRGVLSLALPLRMINAADGGHGDVLMEAVMRPAADAAAFESSATVTPTFGRKISDKCDGAAGERCIALHGLQLMEHDDPVVAIPGGGVFSGMLSFPLSGSNCLGSKSACAPFITYTAAARALAGKPPSFRIRLKFFSDGERAILCTTTPLDFKYLDAKGWSTVRCEKSEVTGEPWL